MKKRRLSTDFCRAARFLVAESGGESERNGGSYEQYNHQKCREARIQLAERRKQIKHGLQESASYFSATDALASLGRLDGGRRLRGDCMGKGADE